MEQWQRFTISPEGQAELNKSANPLGLNQGDIGQLSGFHTLDALFLNADGRQAIRRVAEEAVRPLIADVFKTRRVASNVVTAVVDAIEASRIPLSGSANANAYTAMHIARVFVLWAVHRNYTPGSPMDTELFAAFWHRQSHKPGFIRHADDFQRYEQDLQTEVAKPKSFWSETLANDYLLEGRTCHWSLTLVWLCEWSSILHRYGRKAVLEVVDAPAGAVQEITGKAVLRSWQRSGTGKSQAAYIFGKVLRCVRSSKSLGQCVRSSDNMRTWAESEPPSSASHVAAVMREAIRTAAMPEWRELDRERYADAPGMGALKRRRFAAPFPCRLTRPPPARIDLTDLTEARAAASTRRPAAAKATARAKAAGKGAAKARRNPDSHSRSKLQHLEAGV